MQSNKSCKPVLESRLSSGKQLLEPRASDELGEQATPEWSEQREPILALVAAVLGAGVLGACSTCRRP